MIPERNFIYLHFAGCDLGGSGSGVWSLRDILPAQNRSHEESLNRFYEKDEA